MKNPKQPFDAGRGYNGTNFTREEHNQWTNWMNDPNGVIPHRDTGSRSRPVSIGYSNTPIDELMARMERNGMIAASPKKRRRK